MQEINLYKLLAFYVRNWLLILSLTLSGLLAGFIYNEYVQTPMYKSEATILFINPNSANSIQDVTTINNYVELFESRRVLNPVIEDQLVGITYDEFSSSVEASNQKDTGVINLSVITDNAGKSQRFLNAAISSFKKEAISLYETDKLQVVDRASDATSAYNVHTSTQLIIAAGAALVLSLIILFFIFDATGGKVTKLIKKQKRVKNPYQELKATKSKETPNKDKASEAQKHTKSKKTKKPDVFLSSLILRTVKNYFSTPKEDFMINPQKQEVRRDQTTNTAIAKKDT